GLVAAGVLFGAAVSNAAGLTVGATPIAGAALAVSLLVAAAWFDRRHRVTASHVARHFDRTIPAVEESAELLLEDESKLTPVERLERKRVDAALCTAALPPLPDRTASRFATAGVALAIAGAVLLVPATLRPVRTMPASGSSAARAGTGLRIDGVRVAIVPPAYTALPARDQASWDVETVAGAAIRWRVTSNAEAGRIITSAGDTLPLERSGSELAAGIRVRGSMLYQLEVTRDSRVMKSDFHRLAASDDAAPTIVIARPSGRVMFAPAGSLRVPVEVIAADDYGVGRARLVGTVTSGEGEAVKFRDQSFPLTVTRARPDVSHGIAMAAVIDLRALGLKPGDELYFHAEASDRRTPAPNVGRSETVFLAITDTGHVSLATLGGMAERLAPQAFRSQRQIIIDTERLLGERSRLALQVFRDRSNDIGVDQSLLRGRYGELAGDETESGDDPSAGHEHDMAENATLLAASVKAKLQAALAQMWEAEIRLRTYRPAEALPYEYRALALLKDMQQTARAYVQRTGSEPTPLDPGRTRLTGKLDAITSQARRDSVQRPEALPAVRRALAALASPAIRRGRDPALLLTLEDAESELAPLAVRDSAQFETLRAVRSLATHVRDGTACPGCVARVTGGLWRSLPPATALPLARRPRSDRLSHAYFERIDGSR
nr:hypothetical protein [Gemmatimonadales bacterium]